MFINSFDVQVEKYVMYYLLVPLFNHSEDIFTNASH